MQLAAPFYCHAGGAVGADGKLIITGARLCAGWSEEVGRRFAAGRYVPSEQPTHEQIVAGRALAIVLRFEQGLRSADDDACDAAMAMLDDETGPLLADVFVPRRLQ